MSPMAPGLMALAAPIVSGDSDADLVAWFCMHPDALDEAFSVPEREHALAILGGKIPLTLEQRRKRHSVPLDKAIEGAVANYLRDRMANGDRVQEREANAATDRMFAAMALGRSGNLAVYETPAATMDLMARADGATRAWMPAGDTIEVDEIAIHRGDYTVRIFGIARPRSAS